MKEPKFSKKDIWVFGALVALALWSFFAGGQNDGKLHVHFLDVGQGDAIFIETPSRTQILVDGGPDRRVLSQLSKVMPFFDRSIDAVVLTHGDADHITGLIDVLDRYKVGKVIETGVVCMTPQCRLFGDAKKRARENEIVYFGNILKTKDGVSIDVLNPLSNMNGADISKRNNASVVLRLNYKNQSLLLTGDIEQTVERKLLLSKAPIDADFLKVPHHGSRTSSSEEFLNAVSPLAAFIEVGARNTYGHPTQEVLDRLEKMNIPYYRTDKNGRIDLVLDGENYSIKPTDR